ncbi:hypothetical protein NSERUTF1_5569 [Nocardia seriolae]|nr:hypothetical protein NSERUTF1_5569 [Nocardia seriolae]
MTARIQLRRRHPGRSTTPYPFLPGRVPSHRGTPGSRATRTVPWPVRDRFAASPGSAVSHRSIHSAGRGLDERDQAQPRAAAGHHDTRPVIHTRDSRGPGSYGTAPASSRRPVHIVEGCSKTTGRQPSCADTVPG